ncbi:MAG: DUF1345 domain-containing protein [Xanthobacteraceae bacterium]|nr:MAG: DUF1345 domain-containing protein [Xanthobacteraceae bacterium]
MNQHGGTDPALRNFHKLPRLLRIVRARPRLFVSMLAGLLVFAVLPAALPLVTRLLIAWDASVTLYLAVAYWTFARTDAVHIRRNAILQDDGRFLILVITGIAAFASLGAIVFELGSGQRQPLQLALATVTIALSWAAVHTTFALHYAHEFYRGTPSGGLTFPGDNHPDYWDFVYFSFVIGMTAQVSDVTISDRLIRRTATAHGVTSFLFNTALLALMVNIAASVL